jgi:osmoprotectant transport system substrate-binding protein
MVGEEGGGAAVRCTPSPSILRKVFEGKTLGVDFELGAGSERDGRLGQDPLSGGGFCQVQRVGIWMASRITSWMTSWMTSWGFVSMKLIRRRRSHPWQGRQGWGTRALVGVLAAGGLTALLGVVGCAPPRSSRVVIGAKNFTEQVVLGELLAQEIESVSGERVERRFYLAGSYICQQALVSGRIDGYVEYTGTALTAILKQPLPPVGERDAARVFETVRRLYAERYGVRAERGLGFEDTFAMVVRGVDAQRLGLRTISDAVRVSEPMSPGDSVEPMSQSRDMGHPSPRIVWRLGVGYEFEERPDGLRGLEAAYGLKFAEAPRTMDLGLLYRALASGQVDMVAGNSTDGPIRALGFVALEDDRHYFPPYEAVPLVREDSLRRHPGIQVAMDRLAGRVSAEEVRGMNDAVDGQHKDVEDVVREFRRGKGL